MNWQDILGQRKNRLLKVVELALEMLEVLHENEHLQEDLVEDIFRRKI